MSVTSVLDPRRQVEADQYGPNPLAEDAKGSPVYPLALKGGSPPKLFAGGRSDLPAFTASGIDPKLLLQLPWQMRHAVAAEPDPATVHGIFEQYSDDPGYTMPHQGLDDAITRMRNWLSYSGTNTQQDRIQGLADAADAKRAADLATLSADRRAAILAAAQQGTAQ